MRKRALDKSDNRTGNIRADGRKRRDLFELSVAYGLILIALWTPQPWQRWLSLVALAWVVLATCYSFDGWKTMGFRAAGFWASLWVVGVALVLAAGAVFLAFQLKTLHAPTPLTLFFRRYWAYTIWSLLQEFLLLNFFLLRLLRLLRGKTMAAMAATGLFGFAHLPSPILTAVTLIWGYAACLIFLHYRNIFTPALAHAIFGISIAITIPGPVDHNMRVGLGFLTYRPPRPVQRSQIDQTVSTVAWVMADEPTRRC